MAVGANGVAMDVAEPWQEQEQEQDRAGTGAGAGVEEASAAVWSICLMMASS